MKRLASLMVATAVVVVACSGQDDLADSSTTSQASAPPQATFTTAPATTSEPPTTTPPPQETTAPAQTPTTGGPPTTAPPDPDPSGRSPLTGMEVADSTKLDRRVIAVKIDNHPSARPQSGIQDAEVVYELLVEGGLTRFLALFHSTDSSYVGPIRSVRSTELTILPSLGAVLQTATGSQPVLEQAREAGVNYISITRATTWRIDERNAPHNLYGDTESMRTVADNRDWPDEPPQPIFEFGEPWPTTGTTTRISLPWSGNAPIVWEFDGSRYLRFHGETAHEFLTESGETGQISFETLVVLVVDREVSVSDPSFRTFGRGKAVVFNGGNVVEGTWERVAVDDSFTLRRDDGEPMVIPPGRIWISLFPSNRPIGFAQRT